MTNGASIQYIELHLSAGAGLATPFVVTQTQTFYPSVVQTPILSGEMRLGEEPQHCPLSLSHHPNTHTIISCPTPVNNTTLLLL